MAHNEIFIVVLAVLLIVSVFGFKQLIFLFGYARYLLLPPVQRSPFVWRLYRVFYRRKNHCGYFKLLLLQAYLSAHCDWCQKSGMPFAERQLWIYRLTDLCIALEKYENS